MLELKSDILNGEFGSPLEFKSYSSWRRYDNYYNESDWKGRLRNKNGEWILDAVSTNATAHYLFNIFFMAGNSIETSEMPAEAEVEIYRAKDIETYDTCFIRGSFNNGCKFYYFSTHSGEREINPTFLYKFENAVVTMSDESGKYELIAVYNDGRVKNYGNAMSEESGASKIAAMIKAIHGETQIPCTVDTVMPHIIISNAIFDQAEFANFPKDICYRNETPPGSFVYNLVDESIKCYESMKLPSETGYSWATNPTMLKLAGYNKFSGDKYK
jgi:predicted dehydrogenase